MNNYACVRVSILSLALLILSACGGSKEESDDSDNPPVTQTGSITITVTGLPNGENAIMVLAGPSNYRNELTGTVTLSQLELGTYILSVNNVSSNNLNYTPTESNISIIVSANQTSAVSVVYAAQTESDLKSFPLGLAIASPTDFEDSSAANMPALTASSSKIAWTSAYASAVARINQLLNGEIAVNNAFTPELFFSSGSNASCYGPSLKYSDHPDGALPNSGQLPGGDLMIWSETDSTSGHTCSAAQLNQRLNGLKGQSFAALMSLASMLVVADANGLTLPEVGATIDLTSEMNSLSISGVSFTLASISQSSANQWEYAQEYTYNDGTAPRNILVSLQHRSSEDENVYSGLMAYSVSADNSVFQGGNCAETDRTLNGSLAYDKTSATSLSAQSRIATLCGANAEGFINDSSDSADGQVDPSNQYNPTSNPNGWSENFNLFGVEMNPENLEGSYAYVWQAGVNDSHSRTFLMGVNYNATGGTSSIDGEAYAGFGASVDASSGNIDGIICNWAGPNNNHIPQQYAQRQFFSLDESTGIFNTPTGGSDIAYAPTNSCSYDGTGSFIYDTDLDGDLSDETASPAINIDLMGAFDLDSDGTATVPEAIINRGYTLPEIPGGFPGTM